MFAMSRSCETYPGGPQLYALGSDSLGHIVFVMLHTYKTKLYLYKNSPGAVKASGEFFSKKPN